MMEAALLGLAVGLISVFTGLGGGVVMVPLLPSLLAMSQVEAVATSLFVVLLNSTQLVLISRKNKMVDTKKGLRLSLAGVFASLLASFVLYLFTEWTLRLLLSLALFFAIFLLLFPIKRIQNPPNGVSYLIGALGGGFSGLTGLGGGAIVGPLAYGFKIIDMKNMAPTISFVTMVFAMSATATHLINGILAGNFWGPICWQEGLAIFIPALIVSRSLFSLQKKVPDRLRKAMLIAICSALWIKSLMAIL
tara:strand:+ start:13707 stop:14453 length:747 start_codon:yes stop_codon:yes gene_type:complete